ncbi:MAG: hypothetical protein CME26_17680 [Gemmatimonadetes bacterium]|nr:hypothetical protein [Gemmatimonadota bacterium]|tara:strand:- start:1399 stop:1875 length:477 start_codon:yes stop_codon:yes gene_type:complete
MDFLTLSEGQLREMPQDLREALLKWYFDPDRSESSLSSQPSAMPDPSSVSRRQGSRRVTFAEFVRAGLLTPGSELVCKALKRQSRDGGELYIDAGKVQIDGSVEYNGQRHVVPSKLAIAVVNSKGGNTKALNGYDYLFTRTDDRLVPLEELREQFLAE